MKNILALFLLLLNLGICHGQSDYVVLNDKEAHENLIDLLIYLPKSAAPTTISTSEMTRVNSMMKDCIRTYNDGLKKSGENRKHFKKYKILNLRHYKIQYVPYVNEKGEKEIWINGFCDSMGTDWKKEVIFVFDGGNCFFEIRLNLTTGECHSIGISGYSG
ncbi:hypothetical protein [Flagellimonas sp.]|uniref:hypothetical protein n=1 Tax=Flagellimonas sp. TaxID=2058762 RepID=UPI003B52ABEC